MHPSAFKSNRSGFEDRNGKQVKAGNTIIYSIDGRKGVLDEALQDGDAFVTWDDGRYGTVKWHHLAKDKP